VNLVALTIAAILSTLPATADQQAERARLDPLAAAIAVAVLSAPALPFQGPAAPEATALAVVTIGLWESGWRADVLDCRRKGTRGDATFAQLLGKMARGPYTVEQLCASYELAAERAIAVLVVHSKRCRWGGFGAILGGYGSGSCGRKLLMRVGDRLVDMVAQRCNTFDRLLRRAGISGECYRSGDFAAARD